MRRLVLGGSFLAAVAAAFTVVPTTALADPPTRFHDHATVTFEFDFFCGFSGEGVFNYTSNLVVSADGSTFRNTLQANTVYTNELNGRKMRLSQAGVQTFRGPTVDEAAGTITFSNITSGLYPSRIQTVHGPVLLREAGLWAITVTFDLETGAFISREEVFSGPHPTSEDGVDFCAIVAEALG